MNTPAATSPRPDCEPLTKAQWRTKISHQRRSIPTDVREKENHLLAKACQKLGLEHSVIAAYVPTTREPGALTMLDSLVENGATVLLPVARNSSSGQPEPLRWGQFLGPHTLTAAPFGLQEPTGVIKNAETLSTATAILIPALAIDLRGARLGRGAGFYDRSLPFAQPNAQLIGVVRDCEVVRLLPEGPHDIRVTSLLSPLAGIRKLSDSPGA